MNSLTSAYFRKLFLKYQDDREWSLHSSETVVRLPLVETVHGQHASVDRGAKLWNSLEREAKLATPLKIFKE